MMYYTNPTSKSIEVSSGQVNGEDERIQQQRSCLFSVFHRGIIVRMMSPVHELL